MLGFSSNVDSGTRCHLTNANDAVIKVGGIGSDRGGANKSSTPVPWAVTRDLACLSDALEATVFSVGLFSSDIHLFCQIFIVTLLVKFHFLLLPFFYCRISI